MKRESGAVLLVVLVALAVLAALAGIALRLGVAGLNGLAAERAEFSRQVLAQSALALIGQQIATQGDLPRDGSTTLLQVPGGQVQAQVQAAEGLINPNFVRLPILQGTLAALGASPEQALRLTRAIGAARGAFGSDADIAALFTADTELWPGLVPYLTYLGNRTTPDPNTAPPLLRGVLAGMAQAGVDFTQTAPQRGYYQITLRVLPLDLSPADAPAPDVTRYAVLCDKAGRMHVFRTSWPQEMGE